MKQVAISAITASLVSAACLFVFQTSRDAAAISGGDSTAHVRDRKIGINSESISALRLEVDAIRRQLEQNAGPDSTITATTDPGYDSSGMMVRIEYLEDAVTELTEPGRIETRALRVGFAEPINKISASDAEGSRVHLYAMAETSFEEDRGIPLGDYEDAIGDALHRAGDIAVHSMVCKETACKLTYSRTELPASTRVSDGDPELVDKLAKGAEGHAVEISYASDPSGNDVMYVRLR